MRNTRSPSGAAFVPAPAGAMVMGDFALTAAELPRVMAGLPEAGIDAIAVHRHMMTESPPMSFMHHAPGYCKVTVPRSDLALEVHAARPRR